MKERLQKILSQYGLSSRRGAERLIEAGRVQINGVTAAVGESADPELDEICLDGKPVVQRPELRYLMLNKPRGYITSLHDEQGRKDVSQFVANCGTRVYPVGRLDKESEGLLLLTNDGEFANAMMHPKGQVDKVYLVTVSGALDGCGERLSAVTELDGEQIVPAQVRLLSDMGTRAELEVTIHQGKNRQIRRMCEKVGLKVLRLKRVQEHTLKLGDLKEGNWRYLTAVEIQKLKGSGTL